MTSSSRTRVRLLASVTLGTLLLGTVPLASAQPPAPNAPVVREASSEPQLRRLIEGMRRGEPAYDDMVPTLADGVRSQAPAMQARIVAMGELQSVSLISAAPRGDQYALRFANGPLEASISIDAQGKVAGFGFRVPNAALAAASLGDAELGDFIRRQMDEMDFSGTVLFARQGQPVVVAARGLADREAGIPNQEDSVFRVASMNKMFTAVAIMQLVQSGKLRLDAPVGTYLQNYPNADFARTVTLHHLLSHTGGAGDMFGIPFRENRANLITLQDIVELHGARPGEFAPGTSYAYANYGFILLGRIIEVVSGQTYPAYVHDHITAPAGMTQTGFEPEDVPVRGRVTPYSLEGTTYVSQAATTIRSTSAGGGYSTVGDMLKFSTALTSHKLLDEQHLRLMTTRKANGEYAYGFSDVSQNGLRIYGHGGTMAGQNGYMWIIGDGQAVIVALSNVYPPQHAHELVPRIARSARFTRPDGTPVAVTSAVAPQASEAERAALFRANDPDGDGRLDKAAYRRVLEALAYPERLETLFAQRDANRDGQISSGEYAAPVALAGPPPPTRRLVSTQPGRSSDETIVRDVLDAIAAGAPDYSTIAPSLATAFRRDLPILQTRAAARGPLQSITFKDTTPQGDRYTVQFAHASQDVTIRIDPTGRIAAFGTTLLPRTPAQLAAAFAANDKDRDGKLDKGNYRVLLDGWAMSTQLDALFSRADANQDGFVSLPEYAAAFPS